MKSKSIALAGLLFTGVALAGVAASSVSASSSPVGLAQAMDAADPVTGTWEGTMSADQMPEDIDVTITLEMDDDNAVAGAFTVQDQDAPFEGTFDEEAGTIEGSITDPDSGQSIAVELTVDGDDMTGTITIEAGDMSIVIIITATRDDEE